MGEEEPRTIISGLVEFQPIEQMEVHCLAVSPTKPIMFGLNLPSTHAVHSPRFAQLTHIQARTGSAAWMAEHRVSRQRAVVTGGVRREVAVCGRQGRSVVVLASLKPRNMRGIKSHGMLLCASNKEHTQVSISSDSWGALATSFTGGMADALTVSDAPCASDYCDEQRRIAAGLLIANIASHPSSSRANRCYPIQGCEPFEVWTACRLMGHSLLTRLCQRSEMANASRGMRQQISPCVDKSVHEICPIPRNLVSSPDVTLTDGRWTTARRGVMNWCGGSEAARCNEGRGGVWAGGASAAP